MFNSRGHTGANPNYPDALNHLAGSGPGPAAGARERPRYRGPLPAPCPERPCPAGVVVGPVVRADPGTRRPRPELAAVITGPAQRPAA
jgi:hypothetical protein